MKALLWVKKEEAGKRSGTRTDLWANLPQGSGRSRDAVGELFGVGGRTVQKQVAVVEWIDELDAQCKAGAGRSVPPGKRYH